MVEKSAPDPSKALLRYLPYVTLGNFGAAIKQWLFAWVLILVLFGFGIGIWELAKAFFSLADDVDSEWLSLIPMWTWLPIIFGLILWTNRGTTWIFPDLTAKGCIGFTLLMAAMMFGFAHATGVVAWLFYSAVFASISTLDELQAVGCENYERLTRKTDDDFD